MPELTRHLGDGVYATWTGYSMEIRVNDHRNPVVAELEPSAVQGLNLFMEEHLRVAS